MATDGITHRTVTVNGINMHVAEKGEGPVVLLIHGFPELWYTWRHQIAALAARGYRAIAPDLRGYGDTDAPPSLAEYTIFHLVGDIIALIDDLGQEQVFVVGHDWGAVVAWNLCLLRPDRVKALVNLSVAFSPPMPSARPVDALRAAFGEDYYIVRFQEPGEAETLFAKYGTDSVLRNLFSYRKPGPLFIQELEAPADGQVPLPPWLSEEDIRYYSSKFQKTGFTGPLNYFRSLNRNCELMGPWTGAQVKVPTKFITGNLDPLYNPLAQKFIHGGGLKKFVPMLEEVEVMDGVGHFINEEKPDEINDRIIDFLQKF